MALIKSHGPAGAHHNLGELSDKLQLLEASQLPAAADQHTYQQKGGEQVQYQRCIGTPEPWAIGFALGQEPCSPAPFAAGSPAHTCRTPRTQQASTPSHSPQRNEVVSMYPSPAPQVPNPMTTVAPTLPLHLVKSDGDGPRITRSPVSRHPSSAPVPSNMRNNVPQHVALAVASRRPQTATVGRPVATAVASSRRPATTTKSIASANKGSNGPRRFLAAKKGVQVLRAEAGKHGSAPQMTAKGAAEMFCTQQSVGQTNKLH